MFSILPPLPYQNLKGTFLQISEKLPKNFRITILKMFLTTDNTLYSHLKIENNFLLKKATVPAPKKLQPIRK